MECVICRGVLGALVEVGVEGGVVRSGGYAAMASRVAWYPVDQRPAVEVRQPRPEAAGEPRDPGDGHERADPVVGPPPPRRERRQQDHEPDDAVGDAQRNPITGEMCGRLGGDHEAAGDGRDERPARVEPSHRTIAARAAPVSWLLGMNPRAGDWRSRRR